MSKVARGTAFRARRQRNQAKQCRIEGCHSNRSALSPYCGRHQKAADRWGHPLGHSLGRKHDYPVEHQRASSFIAAHRDHPGIRSALLWIEQWLAAVTRGEDCEGREDMQRLAEHGVTPLAILTETVALFLFSRWLSRRLPDDDRLTYMIGTRVLTLAVLGKRYTGYINGRHRQRSKPLTKTARRDVGRRLRFTLAPLLANIADAMEAEDLEQQQFLADIRKTFSGIKSPRSGPKVES